MAMDWQWQVFLKTPEGADMPYWQWMMSAWGWTLSVSLCALVVALSVGSVIGIIRTLPNSPGWVKFGNAWVELFRNIPLLVQIFLWYHVLPAIFPVLQGVPSFLLVVFALGFFTSARIAEQLRAGIQSLPKGQRYAGMAVGFTTAQYYRYVILPMAYRIIIPTLTSESMNIFKNSSVAFAVSIAELINFAMQAAEETTRTTEIYFGVTVLYVISAMTINRLMALVEKKTRVPGFIASAGGGGH